MNTYMFHMLELAKRAVGPDSEINYCPLCKADEAELFRVNFLSRPSHPDCSRCPLLSLYNVSVPDLQEDCVGIGKHALNVFTDFFEQEDSRW